MQGPRRDVVSLRELLFEPTPLVHVWACLFFVGFFHLLSLRAGSEIGSALFISFSFCYVLFAFRPVQYLVGWEKPPWVSVAACCFVGLSLFSILYTISGRYDPFSNDLGIILALAFPLIAIGKGVLLMIGLSGKAIATGPTLLTRLATSNSFVFHSLRIMFLSFLVWWFGFTARSPSSIDPMRAFIWTSFFILVFVAGVILDRRNRNVSISSTRSIASFSGICVLFFDWSIVSSLRMLDDGTVSSTMIEEVFMFTFIILVILWTRTSRTVDSTETHAALSLGFAYVIMYAGSISSMSASTDLNVTSILGVGHGLTAMAIMLGSKSISKRIAEGASEVLIQSADDGNDPQPSD